MEGIGSRLGRASSRYGQSPVFTGPVRRWQKQWIHVSSSPSSSSSTSFNRTKNRNSNDNNNNISAIRLRRWTPVPPSPGGDPATVTEERPRRKLRYTPIVVLEETQKEAEKTELDTIFPADAQASDNSESAKEDLNTIKRDLNLGFSFEGP